MSQDQAWFQDSASFELNTTAELLKGDPEGEPIPDELRAELKTELEKRAEDCQLFMKHFPDWRDQTRGYITELREIANSIDEYHRGATIAGVTGASAAVLGGVLSISGVIASPFTSGASLGLSALGAGLSATGATTNLTAGVTESVRQSDQQKRGEEIINQYNECCKQMSKYLQEICAAIRSWNQKLSAGIMKYKSSEEMSNLLNEICSAARCRQTEREDFKELRTLSVSKKVRQVTTGIQKTEIIKQLLTGSPSLLSTVLKAISGILSAILLVPNIYAITKDSIDISKGSKTKVAMNIRDMALKMDEELTACEQIHEFLKLILEVD
ncbi:apolipoprotein L6-like [Mustelus asterias]